MEMNQDGILHEKSISDNYLYTYESISPLLSSALVEKLKESLSIIEKTIRDYNFERFIPNFTSHCISIAFSFNGGKDCTVLLHLIYMVFLNQKKLDLFSKLKVLYFALPNSFEEMTQFIQQCKKK